MKKTVNTLSLLILTFIISIGLLGCTKPTISEEVVVDKSTVDNQSATTTTDSTEKLTTRDEANVSDLTALELVELMGNGINLGNTMEAYGHTSLGINAPPSSYETLWGQPITTKEMLIAMKASGFDTIRIPVAWTNAMNYESGDYTIGKDYLQRVEEIVQYALDADMYVIINDHWDGGWWGMFGSATQETRDKAMALYISMWTQIGDHFKDTSDKLIFESANEELGNRLNDVDACPDSGSLSEAECYETTNKINQTFVDTIRSTGGNNVGRFLLIAGYNTDIIKTNDDRFKMPTDSQKDKLLLSVHYYTPWAYCGTDSVTTWGTEKNVNEQNDLLKMMTKFTQQGYGIVIGEYGALPKKDGTLKDNTVDFTKNLLDNCDLYGYVPMLWDCSSFFIRKDLKIADTGLANLFKQRNTLAQKDLTLEQIQENAKASLASAIEIAKEKDASAPAPVVIGNETALAWLMFSSADWGTTYSVGDVYDSTSITAGIKAIDSQITGPGTYTVGLDFTGTGNGFAEGVSFSALGITNGETLYPGYIITLKEILVNGQPYKINGIPYTASDDLICTRMNLFNGWVTAIPKEARIAQENMRPGLSATLLDDKTIGKITTIQVTFDYGPQP